MNLCRNVNKNPALLIFLMIFLFSCNRGNKEQLPVEVKWGRTNCESCRMALSDPRYSVQIIHPNGKAFFFDDIGCAILWLKAKPWKADARTWVNDVNTREWIEAEKANWAYGDPNTPMGYGFSATLSPIKESMDYETVKKWVYIGKTLVNENRARHLRKTDHSGDKKSTDTHQYNEKQPSRKKAP